MAAYWVLGGIALISSGYIVFGSSFAELRLQLSCLDFPIFIGEILLAFCSLFLFIRIFRSARRLRWEGWAWVAYGLFVVLKALYGYLMWGPFALRDAALFYYPLFALIGYAFWREDDWGDWPRRLALVAIFFVLFFQSCVDYWPLSLVILAFILALQEKHVMTRAISIVAILLFAPYYKFFPCERTIVMGSSATAIFIVLALTVGFLSTWPRRLIAGICGLLVVIALIFKMTDPGLWHTMNPGMVKRLPPSVAVSNDAEHKKPLRIFNPDGSIPYQMVNTVDLFLHNLQTDIAVIGGQLGKKGEGREPAPLAGGSGAVKNLSASPQTLLGTPKEGTFCGFSRKRDLNTAMDNSRFRLYIWRDMKREYLKHKPLFGFDFGRPLYSPSLEKYAFSKVQAEDGWVGAHNSFFYMFYKGGVVGLGMVICIFVMWLILARDFIMMRSQLGIMLCAVLLNWLVAANFFLIFELPYTAIPIWTLFGMTIKYRAQLRRGKFAAEV